MPIGLPIGFEELRIETYGPLQWEGETEVVCMLNCLSIPIYFQYVHETSPSIAMYLINVFRGYSAVAFCYHDKWVVLSISTYFLD